jgi:hypothetical protein
MKNLLNLIVHVYILIYVAMSVFYIFYIRVEVSMSESAVSSSKLYVRRRLAAILF